MSSRAFQPFCGGLVTTHTQPSTGVMLRDRIPSTAIMEQITFRTMVGVELTDSQRVAIEPGDDDEQTSIVQTGTAGKEDS